MDDVGDDKNDDDGTRRRRGGGGGGGRRSHGDGRESRKEGGRCSGSSGSRRGGGRDRERDRDRDRRRRRSDHDRGGSSRGEGPSSSSRRREEKEGDGDEKVGKADLGALSSSSSESSVSSASSSSDERRKKRRRRDDGDDDDDEDRGRRKKKRSRKDGKKDRKKKSDRREKKRDRKSRKKEKKREKRRKHGSRSSRSRSRSRSPAVASPAAADEERLLSRNVNFATALQALLTSHPDLSTELPNLLMRLAGGTTFDLSKMPDAGAARGLAEVFGSLATFGVERDGTGSWTWTDGSGGGGGGGGSTRRRPGTELVLLKVVRSLLDGIGVTPEAADAYEVRRKEREEEAAAAANAEMLGAEAERELRRKRAREVAAAAPAAPAAPERRDDGDAIESARSAARSLLSKFDKRSGTNDDGGGQEGGASSPSTPPPPPSLPAELKGICNLIAEGESVVLDGIPDDDLRRGLEGLFVRLGLVRTEVEEEVDSEDEDGGGGGTTEAGAEVTMGYALPDSGGEANDAAMMNVRAVMEECQSCQRGGGGNGGPEAGSNGPRGGARRPVQGPAMGPPPGYDASAALRNYSDDDDDDEGPAPIGSEMARRRHRMGPAASTDAVRAMAERRQLELSDAAGGGALAAAASAATGGREEWMLVPGEHDFLKGIKSTNPCKSRKFKNEKARGGEKGGAADDVPLNPKMQAQMDAIRKAHAEARGPTLIEQHRLKKAEEKAAAKESGRDKDFNWNRDKDLDSGRRVDKNALHQVLGGASDALKDKFQGSFSRGFM